MPQRRPASVTIIGWFWTLIGIFHCLGGISAAWATANPMFVEMTADAPVGAAWRLYPHVAAVLGGFAWYSARSFLGLRAWARTSLETICWLVLIGCLLGVNYLFALYRNLPEAFFAGMGAPIGPVLIALCAVAALVLAVMIAILRGAAVRAAVSGGRPDAPSWPHAPA